LNANDAVFVTQRTTTVDDEVIYYGRRRRLRRRRFFFVFFFFARESKKGKRLEFSSPCVTLLLSLFSFSVAKSNFIIARSFGLRLLKNSDLFSSLSFVGIILFNKKKQKQQTTLTVIFGRVVYEVRVERLKRNRRWLRGRLEEQPIQTEG